MDNVFLITVEFFFEYGEGCLFINETLLQSNIRTANFRLCYSFVVIAIVASVWASVIKIASPGTVFSCFAFGLIYCFTHFFIPSFISLDSMALSLRSIVLAISEIDIPESYSCFNFVSSSGVHFL